MISEAALLDVLELQRRDGRRLGTLLVERGLINETQLTQILSHQLAVPWVSLLHIEFSRQLLNLVPHDVAERYCLVPIYVRHVRGQGNTLYVAMDDPSNEEGLAACREHAGLPVRAMIAPPADIRSAIRAYYGVRAAPAPVAAAEPVREAAPEAEEAPAVEPRPQEEEPAEPPAPEETADQAHEEPPPEPPAPEPEEPRAPEPEVSPPQSEGPTIEAVEISLPDRLRGLLEPRPARPPEPEPEILPRPRGRAPRMVALTLLDGTTINLPAKRARRAPPAEPAAEPPPSSIPLEDPLPSLRHPPILSAAPESTREPETTTGLTARDLVSALRAVASGADASEVLGPNVRWESLFAALLSVMLEKHVIADWEFVEALERHTKRE